MILLGNKSDKADERQVKYEEAKKFADENNLLYFETSVIDMQNINEAFNFMINEILKSKNIENNNLNKNIILNEKEPRDCCQCCL